MLLLCYGGAIITHNAYYDYTGRFALTNIQYSPYHIFSNTIPLFDVNFFNPSQDKYESREVTESEKIERLEENYEWTLIEKKDWIVPPGMVKVYKNKKDKKVEEWKEEYGYTEDKDLPEDLLSSIEQTGTIAEANEVIYWKSIEKERFYLIKTAFISFEGADTYEAELFYADIKDEDKESIQEEIEKPEIIATYESTARVLQPIVSSWYSSLRLLAIVAMLSILVYIGIRIVISSAAKDKSKYKQMLTDWLVALCLLFLMHYIMSFIISVSEDLTRIMVDNSTENIGVLIPYNTEVYVDGDWTPLAESQISSSNQDTQDNTDNTDNTAEGSTEESEADSGGTVGVWYTNFMGTLRIYSEMCTSDTTAFGYTIMYLVLVIFTCVFTFQYMRRVLYMAFLTLIAPLIAITYPIDKVNDGKSQGLNTWLREYIFNALLQPIHMIIYVIIMGSTMELVDEHPVYGLVALGFMIPAEKFIRKAFGFEKAATVGAFGGAAGAAMLMSGIKSLTHRPKKNDDDKDKDRSNQIRKAKGTDYMPTKGRKNDGEGKLPIPGENKGDKNKPGIKGTGLDKNDKTGDNTQTGSAFGKGNNGKDNSREGTYSTGMSSDNDYLDYNTDGYNLDFMDNMNNNINGENPYSVDFAGFGNESSGDSAAGLGNRMPGSSADGYQNSQYSGGSSNGPRKKITGVRLVSPGNSSRSNTGNTSSRRASTGQRRTINGTHRKYSKKPDQINRRQPVKQPNQRTSGTQQRPQTKYTNLKLKQVNPKVNPQATSINRTPKGRKIKDIEARNNQNTSRKGTAQRIASSIGRGAYAVGGHYTRRLENKLRKGKPLRALRRGITFAAGAATLGAIGLAAGIASGDPKQALQYTMAGGMAGGNLGRNLGDSAANLADIEGAKKSFKAGYYGERYDEHQRNKYKKDFKRNESNFDESVKRLGVKGSKELFKDGGVADDAIDRGITDLDDMINIQKTKQRYMDEDSTMTEKEAQDKAFRGHKLNELFGDYDDNSKTQENLEKILEKNYEGDAIETARTQMLSEMEAYQKSKKSNQTASSDDTEYTAHSQGEDLGKAPYMANIPQEDDTSSSRRDDDRDDREDKPEFDILNNSQTPTEDSYAKSDAVNSRIDSEKEARKKEEKAKENEELIKKLNKENKTRKRRHAYDERKKETVSRRKKNRNENSAEEGLIQENATKGKGSRPARNNIKQNTNQPKPYSNTNKDEGPITPSGTPDSFDGPIKPGPNNKKI